MLVYQRVKKCFKNWGVVFFLNPQSHPEIQDINSLGTLSSQDTAQSPTSNRAWSIAQEASRSPVNHPSSHGMNRIQKTRAQGPNTSAMGMTKKPKKKHPLDDKHTLANSWNCLFGIIMRPTYQIRSWGCRVAHSWDSLLNSCEAVRPFSVASPPVNFRLKLLKQKLLNLEEHLQQVQVVHVISISWTPHDPYFLFATNLHHWISTYDLTSHDSRGPFPLATWRSSIWCTV